MFSAQISSIRSDLAITATIRIPRNLTAINAAAGNGMFGWLPGLNATAANISGLTPALGAAASIGPGVNPPPFNSFGTHIRLMMTRLSPKASIQLNSVRTLNKTR